MSQPRLKTHDYEPRQDRELARWPGVTWTRAVRGKHYALVLTFNGVSRFVTYPGTPSDGARGALNHLTDVRHALLVLGARRQQTPKSKAPRRQRNRTETTRLHIEPVTGGPARDPWAALATLDLTQPPETHLAQPKPLTIWARIKRLYAAWKELVEQ